MGLSAINAFDVQTLNAGREAGASRGMANGFAPAMGQAVDNIMKRMDTHLAAQNAMNVQGSKNATDLQVARIGAGYPLDGETPLPSTEPELVTTEGPNGEVMYATKKVDKGRVKQSDFQYAQGAKTQYENEKAAERLKRLKARKEAAATGGAVPVDGTQFGSGIQNAQVPEVAEKATQAPKFDPRTQKLQRNQRTGEYRVVPLR
jgi:hypothetical protein